MSITKPASGTAVDSSNAVAAVLSHCWPLWEGSGSSLADVIGSATGSIANAAGTWTTDSNGNTVVEVKTANSNDEISLGWHPSTVPFGISALISFANTSTGDQNIFSQSFNSGWRFRWSGSWQLLYLDSTGTLRSKTLSSVAPTVGTPILVSVGITSTQVRLWLNGTLAGTQAIDFNGITTQDVHFGAIGFNNYLTGGYLYSAYAFGSDGDLASVVSSLASDPFQMFSSASGSPRILGAGGHVIGPGAAGGVPRIVFGGNRRMGPGV